MDARPGTFHYKVYEEVGALPAIRLVSIDHFVRALVERSGAAPSLPDLDRLGATSGRSRRLARPPSGDRGASRA
jgi:hypothetical protein